MKTLTLTLLCLALTAQAQNTLQLIWTGYGEGPLNYYGAGMTGGDFNADGYSDVLIGAGGWGQIGGNGAIGRDYLYLGSPQFFDTATFIFQGDSAWDNFDQNVSNVQDVNGDSLQDLLIPAAYHIPGGYVEIFYGGQNFDTLADWRVQKQASYFFEFFGGSTDSAGDVNGDGWSDFVISGGDPEFTYRYFEIYYGGPDLDTIADWRYSTEQFNNYPFTVAGLGDVNGDGFDDVLAYKPVTTAPHYSAKIFFGGAPMDTIPDVEFFPYFISAGGIGDVNADGYNDLAAYKRFGDVSDSIYSVVYYGGAEMDTIPDVILQGIDGPGIKSTEGFSCGDVNGDGISDIICSGGWQVPILYVYLGGHWFNPVPDWWHLEFYMLDGFNMAGAGDVNGDGCDEVLLGMYNWDSGSWADPGKVYLFAGNDTLTDLGAGVQPEELVRYPGWFRLEQNYPNPFNTSTSIHFELGKPSCVNLKIYDIRGNEIKQLITDKQMLPGGYNVSWNGKNEQNQQVSSGIYLLELRVDQYRQLRKIALLR